MRKLIFMIFASVVLMSACAGYDCTMNNMVYTMYKICDKSGAADTLRDTMSIWTDRNDGNDTVLINRMSGVTGFNLPISHAQPEDVFFIQWKGKTYVAYDTIKVTKEATPHFESADCQPSFFHKITGVKSTDNIIDSIVINNPNVTYDKSKEHFRIYIKSSGI